MFIFDSFYLVLTLFIGFLFIYINSNKYIIIEKKHKKICFGDKCFL